MSETTVTRGEAVTFGHPEAYGLNGLPTGTWVTVDDEPFIEWRGSLYAVCAWCDHQHPGVKTWYGHILGGVCFQCDGRGVTKNVGTVEQAVKVAKRRHADRARRAAKAEAKAAAQAAERDGWATAHPEVVAALAEVLAEQPDGDERDDATWSALRDWEAKWGEFLTSLAQQAQWRPLTEAQTAAVLPAVEQVKTAASAEAEAAAKRHYLDVEKGAKVAVSGAVAVAVTVETMYGASRLVVVEGTGEHEGVTVKMFGTGATLWEASRGDQVTVTGAVKDFEEYEGVPQTVLTRAKVTVEQAADSE